MTPETREALKEFAQGVKLMAGRQAATLGEHEFYGDLQHCADRLIRALEQEFEPVQPLRRPTVNLIAAVKLAVLANGGFAHKKEMCRCDASVGMAPCEYCAIHEGLTKAFTFLRALQHEKSHGECSGVEITPWAELTRKREAMVKAIANDYETWRDEQLDTLRKLFRQRGPSEEYKSFPDFCLEQFGESGKGKVKV